MQTFIFEKQEKLISYRFAPLFIGITLILSGILTLINLFNSIETLLLFYSISLLIIGGYEAYYTYKNKNLFYNWNWNISIGIITFLIGLIILIEPFLDIFFITFYISLFFIFRAVTIFSFSFELFSKYSKSTYFVFLAGIILFVLGTLLLLGSHSIINYFNLLIGISFLITGLYNYYYYTSLKEK